MPEPRERSENMPEGVPEHCASDDDVTVPITVENPPRRPTRAPTISTPESDDDEPTDVGWPPED